MRILLAEDEKALSKALIKIFEKNNFAADAVYNGEDALDYINSGDYDIAILDIMMPVMDGITVLKKVRSSGNKIPVIMLTAKSEIEDRVLGLDSGANDYLPKPFDTRELLARIRSATRGKEGLDNTLVFGNLSLNRATFELSSPKDTIKLTNKEYQMMEFFMANPHCVFSTERFMDRIWGYESEAEINVVWVNISNLRKKLNSLDANVQIKVSRNAGYSLEECDDK